MDKINEMETLIASAKVQAEKFYNKGNKAAGVRLRKHMQDLKAAANELRGEVLLMSRAFE